MRPPRRPVLCASCARLAPAPGSQPLCARVPGIPQDGHHPYQSVPSLPFISKHRERFVPKRDSGPSACPAGRGILGGEGRSLFIIVIINDIVSKVDSGKSGQSGIGVGVG